MKLIKDDIIKYGLANVTMFCDIAGIDPARLIDRPYIESRVAAEHLPHWADTVDFYITTATAQRAQTFIFDSAQIMAFLDAIDRRLAPGDYQPPFPEMIIQFSEPIVEQEFLTGVRTSGRPVEHGDRVLGLVLGFPTEQRQNITMSAWFESTSVNRAVMQVGGDGALAAETITGTMQENAIRDKQRILNLGMLCIAYINSPGIEIEHVEPDAAVNRKRAAKGKRELPDYYICQVRHERRADTGEGEATGRHVGFMFPVRGHLRRFSDGRTVWVRAHFRGVEHGPESVKPKVYKVD